MKVYSPKEVWFKQVSVYMYMKIQIVGKFKWSGTKMIIIKKNIKINKIKANCGTKHFKLSLLRYYHKWVYI
jgi:hypothetical protein